MHPAHRHERILAELRVHGTLSAADFAEREGVSAMTVRRDLRDLADRGLLRRVHGGAASIDTLPSGGAPRIPSPRRSPGSDDAALFTLGLVVPDPAYYYPPIVSGVAERAESLGGRVILGVSRYEPARERAQIERLIAQGVDGLLVTTTTADAYETFELLERAPMPVVMVERTADDAVAGDTLESVRTDHAAGAVAAVRHLASLGHASIGFATFFTPTSPYLEQGFAKAIARLGLDEEAPVATIDADERVTVETRAFVERCRERGTTAVVVHSDNYAVDFAETVRDMGIDIPGDLAIVAYDDEVAELATVPLTAVAPPKRDVGRFAATMCFERISTASDGDFARRHLLLAPTLSVRASTVAP